MKRRLDSIVFDAGTQIRAAIDQQVVADYAEAMTSGATFPPIVLFHDGNHDYLADGFHRFLAAQRNEWREIDADVRPGTKHDALRYALGANKLHGKRLTDADIRNAITIALTTFLEMSQNQIAALIGCGQATVSRVKAEVIQVNNLPARVTGKDGKSYPATHEQKPRPVTDQRLKARELVQRGLTVKEIREATGLSCGTIIAAKRDLGIAVRDNTTSAVQERRDRMRAMAAEGHTSRQMAAELGLTDEGCREILRQEQIDVPGDRATRNSRHADANRIVGRMALDAEVLTADVNLIDFKALDPDRIGEWIDSFVHARKALDGFIKRLIKEKQKHGEAA